jgi:hypothetical protein
MMSLSLFDITLLSIQFKGMSVKASTHRFDPEVQTALSHLSKLLKQPKNRLINEAVKLYVQQRSQELEKQLEDTLKSLRSYRRKDSDFEKAIGSFVKAEARLGDSDPLEGKRITKDSSVRAEIRHLLHA